MKGFSRSFGRLFVAFAALSLGSAHADPWDDTGSIPDSSCVELNQTLVAPVPPDHRAAAIAKLSEFSAIPLSEDQAASVLALGGDSAMASASGRIKAAIAKLREQKRLELEKQVGSWGPYFQQRLDALEALDASATVSHAKPYLVRAVAKNEFTGGFFVSVCGDTLRVIHGSLGRGPLPPTIRLPIVVFLNYAPKSVLAHWSMAE